MSEEVAAGRELDALVAEKVMGLLATTGGSGAKTNYYARSSEVAPWENTPHYSTDIAAAWLVVEAMAGRDMQLSLDMFGGDPWWAEFADRQYVKGAQATATTAPHAICLAALKAMEHIV